MCFCANQTNQISHLALPGSARLVCPSILTSGLVPCPANMAERTESDWTIAPRVSPARAAVYPDPWAIVTSWLTQSAHNSQRSDVRALSMWLTQAACMLGCWENSFHLWVLGRLVLIIIYVPISAFIHIVLYGGVAHSYQASHLMLHWHISPMYTHISM